MYKVLLTAIGCHNGITLIKNLQKYGVRVIGTDVQEDIVAASLIERFYKVPMANSERFVDAINDIVYKESPDVLVAEADEEVEVLSRHAADIDTNVMVTSLAAVRRSRDKWQTYNTAKSLNVPVPESDLCTGPAILLQKVREYVERFASAVLRPVRGRGSRGLHVVVPNIDRMNFDWHTWPSVVLISLDELVASDLRNLSYPLIVSEPENVLEECAYEGYCVDGEILTGFLKHKGRVVHSGYYTLNMSFEHADLELYTRKLVANFEGNSFVDIQFIGGKLMEINPRLSTLIYTPEYNMVHFGILHTLGHMSDAEIVEKRLEAGRTGTFYWDVHYE